MCECQKIPSYWTASANDTHEVDPRDLIAQLLEKKEEVIQSGFSETWYQCLKCKTSYVLMEDIGYHYPVFTLKKLNT